MVVFFYKCEIILLFFIIDLKYEGEGVKFMLFWSGKILLYVDSVIR